MADFFETFKSRMMRRKFGIVTMFFLLFSILFCGCATGKAQESKQEEGTEIQEEGTEIQADSSETIEEETTTEANNCELVSSQSDINFEVLSQKAYSYSSGAGAWSEDFKIQKDGSFYGDFHDSDMGDSGDDYPNGTIYISSYSGHFTDLTKINDTVYEMKLADISYDTEPDSQEYSDDFHYVYTKSLCFEGADIITIYLPGTPIKEIPEDVYWWLSAQNSSKTELTTIALANLSSQIGIYSHDKISPLEDAEMTYDNYKESYDYYSNQLTGSMTTMEMVKNAEKMYEVSDECLNDIWTIIKYNVSEKKFEAVLAEQRAWINQKEARGKEIRESDGGSLTSVDYNTVLADMTISRCEELIDYLKE